MDDAIQLYIFVLGTPYLQWSNRRLDIPRRQVRALLYRLAADHPLPVSRDHLCYLFWPDETQIIARRRLTHLQTHLQDALAISEILISTNDDISLNSDLVWLDIVAFERLSNVVQARKVPDTCLEARQLYRGAFLEGFTLDTSAIFEDWIRRQQAKYEQKYLGLLEKIIERFSDAGAYDFAIECCHTYLEIDELAEHIHHRLIALYQIVGKNRAARKQLEIYEALVQRECDLG